MRRVLLGLCFVWGMVVQAAAQPAVVTAPQSIGGVPVTPDCVELGRKFFFDPRVSADNTIACATCHRPDKGWGDGLPVAVGIDRRLGTRNSQTCLHAAFQERIFWDGRTDGIAEQALQPLTNPDEMGNDNRGQVYRKLNSIPYYRNKTLQLYGQQVNDFTFSHAVASFQSKLWRTDAPIDRWNAGDKTALSPTAQIGLAIAMKSGCFECHTGMHYRDGLFHNTGIAFRMRSGDQGREGIDDEVSNRRAFKTPTWREIARTGPYMHNGSIPTLGSVVSGYNQGWQRIEINQNGQAVATRDRFADPRIRPLGMTPEQQAALVRFLEEAFSSPSYPNIPPPALP